MFTDILQMKNQEKQNKVDNINDIRFGIREWNLELNDVTHCYKK